MSEYALDKNVVKIPVDEIRVGVNVQNIRTVFSEDSILELAESIHANGLINPLVVMETEDQNGNAIVELVCGARRLRAIQWILNNVDEDWHDGEVNCTVLVGSLSDADFLNGLENIDREDIDEVDKCNWVFRMTERGFTQEELAQRAHKSAQWISSRLTVHRRGSDKLKAALRDRLISFSAAYKLAQQLSLEEQDKRIDRARKFDEKLTLAEAEVAGDENRVAKPNKKRLTALLTDALAATTNEKKKNAYGVAMGLQFVLGLASEEEVRAAITWEQEEDAPAPSRTKKK